MTRPTRLTADQLAVYVAGFDTLRASGVELPEEGREMESLVREVIALRAEHAWQPIASAPTQKRILVRFLQDWGVEWTTIAAYYPIGTMPMSDESHDDDVDENGNNVEAGWWEELAASELSCRINTPISWLPLAPAGDGRC